MSLVVLDYGLGVSFDGGLEQALDLGAQGGQVGFDGDQVAGARSRDGGGDARTGGDGVDGDEGVLEAVVVGQSLDQDGNGGGFLALSGTAS